ncbi:hypothetical protein ABZ470_03945 [Streptosporangium sp. NPDC020072]|uniref:hypothetical protein n=1 Tax=Streptosporangium sp. NPDC020072 TaxID=3154788 RepID=UPI00343FD56C
MNTPPGQRALEQALRSSLTRQAGTVAEHSDPYGATLRRIHRARRRRRNTAAGALALTTALTTVLTLVLVRPATPHDPGDRVTTVLTTRRTGPDWPARGELAGDPTLLTALRTRLGDPGARVLYAGDRAGHRVIVAVSPKNPAMGGTVILYGTAGTPVEALRADPQPPNMTGRDGIAWISADPDHTLIVLGPPRTTAVKISPSVTYRSDGTPTRRTRTLRTDDGLILTPVPDAAPGHVAIKIRLGERFGEPVPLGWPTSQHEDPAFRPDLTRAAAAAEGHVDREQAQGLLWGLGALATPPWRLTYRYLWGGPLGAGRDALIATVSGPETPTFLAVQTTYTAPDGSTTTDRLGRPAGDLSQPVGWTTDLGGSPAAAVRVPNGAGVRVELREGNRTIATASADATGLALFSPPGLSRERLRACGYRVLGAGGKVLHRGGLDIGDLHTAVLGGSDW